MFVTMYKTDNTQIEIQNRAAIETRESQLWWLAVIVIVFLAVALLAIDASNTPGKWWVSPQLEIALNLKIVRISLVIATLLICAYFRDSARYLRRKNNELISDLAEHSKQLEKKNYEVSRLKELSDQLIELTDVRAALDMILGIAVEFVGADTASIMIVEKESDTLRIVASRGLSPDIVESTRIKVGEAIAGRVAEEGKAVILNTDELKGDLAKRVLRGNSILSSVVVPIQVGDDVRGVVSTAKRRGGVCFNDEDLEVLTTLATQASLIIQKTDLLDNLKNQVEILAATVEELRQAQAELMQSEKLASIGQLAGGVAHEINNPLQVILGRVELLLSRKDDEQDIRDLNSILEHGTRVSDIVSNLLSFSRQSSNSEYRNLDLNEVVNKTLNLLEPQMIPDDVVLVRQLQSETLPVHGNGSQLQQVFTNIAFNAYQAMCKQGGGKLTVKSRLASDVVEVEFTDTGPGIPQEHLDHLFEPFYTTKPEGEGTGLGLSIAYGIVHSHGGRIEVSNASENGASFTVYLPLKQSLDNSNSDLMEESAA